MKKIYMRASKLKGRKIGRSPYLLNTQSGDFYGEFSKKKNSLQQLLSCDYINKTCSVNRTSVAHIDTIILYDTSAHVESRCKT